VKKGERNVIWRKVPVSKVSVYLFANPFSRRLIKLKSFKMTKKKTTTTTTKNKNKKKTIL